MRAQCIAYPEGPARWVTRSKTLPGESWSTASVVPLRFMALDAVLGDAWIPGRDVTITSRVLDAAGLTDEPLDAVSLSPKRADQIQSAPAEKRAPMCSTAR